MSVVSRVRKLIHEPTPIRRKVADRLFALALTCLPLACAGAIHLTPIVSSGLSSPIFAGNANDGSNRLFIVEQGGVVKVLQPGSSTPTVFLDIRSRTAADGERGLLGLAFHPNCQSTRRFFVIASLRHP